MFKINMTCQICNEPKDFIDEEVVVKCDKCGEEFEANSVCVNGHYVCHLCRQKAVREDIIEYCLNSKHDQPYPLVIELMKLPNTAMHGPEHHLLLTAALLTAYCNQKGKKDLLEEYLNEANERSLEVPGGACGYWGICGCAIGSGIYMSIITESSPFEEEVWKTSGQLSARCAHVISNEGGPRCCKRDSFLALMEAIKYSNDVLGTHFNEVNDISCEFFLNNEECKGIKCPFFKV